MPFIIGRNEVVAKVIFLHLSVILFTGGVPDQQTPPGADTPRSRPPTPGADTPLEQTPRPDTPPGTKYTPCD